MLDMFYDIIIAGGGLVGASLGLALSNEDFKIALIDKSEAPNSVQENLDARALALSYVSVTCLNHLGIWSKCKNQSTAITEVHISKKGYFGMTQMRPPKNYSKLGEVINADVLNFHLNQALHTISNLSIYRPCQITQIEHSEKDQQTLWQVKLNTGQSIFGNLLVAADGSDSFIRKSIGIQTEVQSYDQMAILCNIKIENPHKGIAYERFIKEGSIAMLPMSENRMKCVWIMPKEKANTVLNLENSQLLNLIQSIFGYRLGYLREIGKPTTYFLNSIRSKSVYAERCVLIGNAANTLHPIAAQGFNLGLRDVAALVETLEMAKKENMNIASSGILKKYADWRRSDHQFMYQLTEKLINIQNKQMGILATQFFESIKNWITHKGMGFNNKLPSLLLSDEEMIN